MSTEGGRDARSAAHRFLALPLKKRIGSGRRREAGKVRPADRGLFAELVAGTTRRQVTLDHLIKAYSHARVDRIQAPLLAALRLGLYQLVYLDRIPDHAAVSETLRLLPARRARGFANGILRAVVRESGHLERPPEAAECRRALPLGEGRWFLCGRDFLPDPAVSPGALTAACSGFSEESARLLAEELGDERSAELMRRANERPRSVLRVGRDCADNGELAGMQVIEESADGRLLGLPPGKDPASLKLFRDGKVTVQGPFAAGVVPFMAPELEGIVLDLCAPPGGKTVQLAQAIGPEAVVAYAADLDGCQRLKETLERCGVGAVRVVEPGDDPWAVDSFRAVLLDVPCSNTGVLARRPEARHRLCPADLESLRTLQRSILTGALRRLAKTPGNKRLVYSTCSVLPSENGLLVRSVVDGFPGAALQSEREGFPDGLWRDGGYAALISLRGSSSD